MGVLRELVRGLYRVICEFFVSLLRFVRGVLGGIFGIFWGVFWVFFLGRGEGLSKFDRIFF